VLFKQISIFPVILHLGPSKYKNDVLFLTVPIFIDKLNIIFYRLNAKIDISN